MPCKRGSTVACFAIFVFVSMFVSNITGIHANDKSDKYLKKAKELIEEKQLDRAVTQLTNILQYNPDHVKARLLIGDIRLKQMIYEEAFDQVREILTKNENNKEAIVLGKKIFSEVLFRRDFNSYRNFIFYSCNNVFGTPHPITEKFLIYLLNNHKRKFVNSRKQISEKGNVTIYTLSNVYSSFTKTLPVLTKYFIYKNLAGKYPARIAIDNMRQEEKERYNPELMKNK